ncbi:MAG TPA: hypothetical protein VHT73_11665, partial [Thermodesulfobacteriota bacterium]|nr:hypothetical protein [Thermodesulfobacteriota bacterium]
MARKKKTKCEFQASDEENMCDDSIGELLISFIDEEEFETSLEEGVFAQLDECYVDDYGDSDKVEDVSSVKDLE